MKHLVNLFLVSSLFILPAAAQAPAAAPQPETVYSDTQRDKDMTASRETVETMLASAFTIDNQYAKWKVPVCARVFGLAGASAWFIEHRIREIALSIGAPVNGEDGCRPNVAIFFTDDPKAVLEAIASAKPFLVDGGNQKVVVKYPAQAWYTSMTKDFTGVKTLDGPFELRGQGDCVMDVAPPRNNSLGSIMGASVGGETVGFCEMPYLRANDSRLSTGVTAELAATTLLVDSNVVKGMALGEVSDYLSFLTLAQAQQSGHCQARPTIANLVLKGCAAGDTVRSLSHVDKALLTALYEVPDSPEAMQKQRIVGAMRRSLEAQFGKQ